MASDIEDFSIEDLMTEINRRVSCAREGLCWYCGRELTDHTCRESLRPASVADPALLKTDLTAGDMDATVVHVPYNEATAEEIARNLT